MAGEKYLAEIMLLQLIGNGASMCPFRPKYNLGWRRIQVFEENYKQV